MGARPEAGPPTGAASDEAVSSTTGEHSALGLPRIGLTARRHGVGEPNPLVENVALQATYSDAIERAGGLPVLLAPREIDDGVAASIVGSLNGLLLTGGADVNPALYGEEAHPSVRVVDDLQDSFELALLRGALDQDIPVLAVCRGLQVLNVALGGSLRQHILDDPGVGAHGVPFGGGGTRNEIRIRPDSLLAEVLGGASAIGECHHHQAVGRVADGLRVVAKTADDTIEALEMPERTAWMVAVQWHPEDTAATDPQQQRLFDELVRQAADRTG